MLNLGNIETRIPVWGNIFSSEVVSMFEKK